MSEDKNYEKPSAEQLRDVAFRLERLCSWLRSEFGYDSDSPGNVNRNMNEINRKANEAVNLLRGEKDQIGIVGKVELLFKSWHVLLSVITLLVGYILRMLTETT